MILRIPLEAQEFVEMAASGAMVGKPCQRMRVARRILMITRAACMPGFLMHSNRSLSMRDIERKPREVLNLAEQRQLVEISIYTIFHFSVVRFFELISNSG